MLCLGFWPARAESPAELKKRLEVLRKALEPDGELAFTTRTVLDTSDYVLKALSGPQTVARTRIVKGKRVTVRVPIASKVNALLDVPTATLLQAMPKAVAAAGHVDNYRPVVDGRSLKTHPFDPGAPAISADVPLMIGSCETELTFSYSQAMENFSYNAEQALNRIKGFTGVDNAQARQLMDVYRASRPQASPSDLWVMISTDHQYRRNGIRASELKAAQGKAPSWHYLFTWKTPVLGGLLRSPHTICIPFSFGNVDIASGLTGTGADRYPLQEKMMDAWHAFMKSGNPNHQGLSEWKPYTEKDHPTMIFDNQCRLINDPASEERTAISACPEYRADGSHRG